MTVSYGRAAPHARHHGRLPVGGNRLSSGFQRLLLDYDFTAFAAPGARHPIVGSRIAVFAKGGLADSVPAGRTLGTVGATSVVAAQIVAIVTLLLGRIDVSVATVRTERGAVR